MLVPTARPTHGRREDTTAGKAGDLTDVPDLGQSQGFLGSKIKVVFVVD